VSPGNDERRPRQGSGATSSNRSSENQSTRQPRQNLRLRVVAQATLVTARTGRQRYLLVYRCHCGAGHVSHTRVVTDVCRCQAVCGLGLVELHLSQAAAA